MSLFREIRQAVSGHGHDCACSECMAAYHTAGSGLDSAMIIRLIAAGVLFFSGIALKNTLPVVFIVAESLACVIAGYDLVIRSAVELFRRKMYYSTAVVIAVLIAAVSGRAAAAAGIMILYRSWMQFIRTREANRALFDNDDRDTISRKVFIPLLLFTLLLIGAWLAWSLFVKRNFSSVLSGVASIVLFTAFPITYSAGAVFDLAAIKFLSGQGVAARNLHSVENFADVRTVVIDKAGVLDSDRLCVVGTHSERLGDDILLRIAAHAGAYSETAYAKAVRDYYTGTIYIDLIQSFQQDDGGITVLVDGVPILFGLAEYLQAQGVDCAEDITDDPSMYLAINGEYAGKIIYGDAPAEQAEMVVDKLYKLHISPVLFTNCSLELSKIFADRVGISRYYASPISRQNLLKDLYHEQKHGALAYATTTAEDEGISFLLVEADGKTTEQFCLERLDEINTVLSCVRRLHILFIANTVLEVFAKLFVTVMMFVSGFSVWAALLAECIVMLVAAGGVLCLSYRRK